MAYRCLNHMKYSSIVHIVNLIAQKKKKKNTPEDETAKSVTV